MPAGRAPNVDPQRPAGLKADLDRRMNAAQAAMRAHEVRLLVAVCAGAPSQAGWVRYFTGAPLWGQRAFLILRSDDSERVLVTRSPDDTEWLRLTAIDTRVESTLIQKVAPVDRLITLIRGITGGTGRIGFLHVDTLVLAELMSLRRELPEIAIIDMTADLERLRRIKSPYEIEAIRHTGRILAEGFELFAERARPGRLAAEVAGEVDGFVRAKGCTLGEARYAFGGSPFPTRVAPDRRFRVDDVVLLHLAYVGPQGYWYELASVFSFRTLSAQAEQQVRTSTLALQAAAQAARSGSTYRALAAAVDRVFTDHGLRAVDTHIPHCHGIGTDEEETPFPTADDWPILERMVLALHPALPPAKGQGFPVAETFLVEQEKAAPLSPVASLYRQLAPS